MALVNAAWNLTVELIGEEDSSRNKSFEIVYDDGGLDEATAFANAVAERDALVAALDAGTDAGIRSANLTLVRREDTLVSPAAGVNVYKEAFATVALDPAGFKKANVAIPAPNAALLASTGRTIDDTSAAWTNFVARFMVANDARLSDGETVRDTDPLVASRVRTVSSGKRY